MVKPIGYTKEMREIAKKNKTWLATVDVRGPGAKSGGGTIQTPARKWEHLDWFLAFSIHLLSSGKSPQEAWDLTCGSPNCPKKVSGIRKD